MTKQHGEKMLDSSIYPFSANLTLVSILSLTGAENLYLRPSQGGGKV